MIKEGAMLCLEEKGTLHTDLHQVGGLHGLKHNNINHP